MLFTWGIVYLKLQTTKQLPGMNGTDRKYVSPYPRIKDELETCLGFKLRALHIRDQSDN